MKQVKLKAGTSEMTCWVDKPVVEGDSITLKKIPDVWWKVIWAGEETKTLPNRGWSVGGL